MSALCANNLESHCENWAACQRHAAPERAAMSSYRGYFLDATNRVAADHFVECETDDLAQARANELLADIEYPLMEVCDGVRFVY
jgi:hypothetical protein